MARVSARRPGLDFIERIKGMMSDASQNPAYETSSARSLYTQITSPMTGAVNPTENHAMFEATPGNISSHT
jgi:hypothetical protein